MKLPGVHRQQTAPNEAELTSRCCAGVDWVGIKRTLVRLRANWRDEPLSRRLRTCRQPRHGASPVVDRNLLHQRVCAVHADWRSQEEARDPGLRQIIAKATNGNSRSIEPSRQPAFSSVLRVALIVGRAIGFLVSLNAGDFSGMVLSVGLIALGGLMSKSERI